MDMVPVHGSYNSLYEHCGTVKEKKMEFPCIVGEVKVNPNDFFSTSIIRDHLSYEDWSRLRILLRLFDSFETKSLNFRKYFFQVLFSQYKTE